MLEEGQAFQVARKGKNDMDCPCRSGLSDGFDLRSGMGQGGTGGSPPTSNPLSATAGPQHFSGLQWYRGTLYLPGDLPYLYLL